MEDSKMRAAGPGGMDSNDSYVYTLAYSGAEIDSAITGWHTAQDQANATPADIAQGKKAITKMGLVTGTLEAGGGNSMPIVTTAGSGSAYTATVEGITSLTNGLTITIIPHVVSTSISPTLNINGLGAKTIKRRYSYTNSSTASGQSSSWLTANKAQLLQYDGAYWIAVGTSKPYGPDMYGTVSVSNGGTGKTSWTANRPIYASSSSVLAQSAAPTADKSLYAQDKTGAPYWMTPDKVRTALQVVDIDTLMFLMDNKLNVDGDATSVNGLKFQVSAAEPTTLPANTVAFVFEE